MTTPQQTWNADDYERNARFVPHLGQPVFDLLRWSLCDERGDWTADYTRLRFAAVTL